MCSWEERRNTQPAEHPERPAGASARAGALLHEVHRLASAYGWSEAQILALSPARRAQYLALVEGMS